MPGGWRMYTPMVRPPPFPGGRRKRPLLPVIQRLHGSIPPSAMKSTGSARMRQVWMPVRWIVTRFLR